MADDPTHRDLKDFLTKLATDPERQAEFAGLTPEELRQRLIDEGLSEEDADLLVNAQSGGTGQRDLNRSIGGDLDLWNVHASSI
jgi:hypothetical protein